MKRKYVATIIIEQDCETIAEGLINAKATLKLLGLKGDVKPVKSVRTGLQNDSMWLLFTQLADELNEKGLDMRHIIRPEVMISWTPYNINEFMWKPLLKALTGKNSTTKMDKVNDIKITYNNLNRIIIERTKGEVCLPPWPSIETLIYKQ